MLIDFHTHLFPDRIAHRALDRVSKISGGQYHSDGTQKGTLERMKEWGVDYAVTLHIATKSRQQEKINRFALEIQQSSEKLFSFGSVFPDADNAVEMVSKIKDSGLRGIKLHPEYQDFFLGDQRYFPLYDAIQQARLPLSIHAGWDPVGTPGAPLRASAKDIALVAKAFPKLIIIAAHMGSLGDPESSGTYLADLPNVYFDTAMSGVFLQPKELGALIHRKGANRVLFGTDLPWDTVPKELDVLYQAGLSQEELELVLWKNAARLLRLPL